MKKVLFLIAVLAVCLSVPALAQVPSGYIPSGWYMYEFSTDFDNYNCTPAPMDIAGQDGWQMVGTAARGGKVVHNTANALSPDHYYEQNASVKSMAVKDMRVLNSQGSTYLWGNICAWVWDPKLPSTSTTDTRVGICSSVKGTVAGDTIGDNIGKNITMNITSGAGLTGDYNYWRGQWSYSAFSMDGVTTPAGGTGYSFTVGPAAHRVAGWNFAMMSWYYTYADYPGVPPAAQAAHVEWFIRPKLDGTDVPNMTLDFNTTSSRWANSKDVAGMVIGSYNVSCTDPGRIDNVYFGSGLPEPAGLMTLGAGILGLAGFIRRRNR